MSEYYKKHEADCFLYNGKVYFTGTKFLTDYRNCNNTLAFFAGYSEQNPNDCVVTIRYPYQGRTHTICIPKDEMEQHINEIVAGNYYLERAANKRYFKDTDVPELFFGWVAYIAIMLVLTIFNDRFLGWVGVSCYFFWWRSKEKEKHVYYVNDIF